MSQLSAIPPTITVVPTDDPTALPLGLPDAGLSYAAVAVDVPLAHLDRPFDYRVPSAMLEEVVPGCRVKVRFAGRLRDGFVLEVRDHTDHDRVQPLERVVSPEPVLTPTVAGLVRAVADHWAGSFADVVRLAVPPRHATTEKAEPRQRKLPTADELRARVGEHGPGPFAPGVGGPALLAALGRGESPRAAWQPVPCAAEAGDWAYGFALAAAATAASGRGSLLIVPDVTDLARLTAACTEVLGADTFVSLHSDLGPSARYRAFLAAVRGQVRVVIGTRAAAFAPVTDLGLVALWDDGDDLYAEPRAPYPHTREVLALRASREQAGALFGSYARTAEVADLVARDWLRTVTPPREVFRRLAPRPRIASDDERALDRDPAARAARLPRDVFAVMRAGLAAGPVLVQVPRAGYLSSLVCRTCRTPVHCPRCSSPVSVPEPRVVRCTWAGHPVTGWECPECGDRHWRAPVVGAARTAEELGKAFPQVAVRRSSGERRLDLVEDEPALVVATPGAEPRAAHGYAAAVLLDASLLLQRMDLRAAEEALRRWWNATALVRPGTAGGTAIAVGPPESPTLQAFLRQDPVGTAERELGERQAAGFPPAARMVAVEGPSATVAEVVDAVLAETLPPDAAAPTVLGPGPVAAPAHSEDDWVRTSLTVPAAQGAGLVTRVRTVLATRTAYKAEGTVRVRVDPISIS